MFHIHIITLGKLKETYWQEAEKEYIKRLQPFLRLSIHELKEESFSDKDKPEIIKAREAEKIKKVLGSYPDAYVIALDEEGKNFDSIHFSSFLEQQKMNTSEFVFIIGGPLGLDRTLRQLAKATISFSKMTFTHQMMRIILLEQLYRSQMIAAGRKYHY